MDTNRAEHRHGRIGQLPGVWTESGPENSNLSSSSSSLMKGGPILEVHPGLPDV